MKKITTLSLLIALACTSKAKAQTAAKSIYAEMGGPGLATINFDMRFQKKEDGFGGRIGVGGYIWDGDRAIYLPCEVNFLAGKDNKNYFEFGMGVTYTSTTLSSSDLSSNFTSTFGHLWFGYRLQPKEGGFLFRVGICPIFGGGDFMPYYGGISFGYKF